MQPIVYFLKEFARVTSPVFVLTLFGVGIAMVCTRRFLVWGRRWLVATLLGMWFLSTPFGSNTLAAPFIAGQRHIESAASAPGIQAIVVLGGGTGKHVAGDLAIEDLGGTALRVLEGVRLYRLLGEPLMIMSGGPGRSRPPRPEAVTMAQALAMLDVPRAKVIVEDRSATTRDQAVLLKEMFAQRGIERFVLVTSPTHMGRSLSTFRAVGLNPIPSTSLLRNVSSRSRWSLMPEGTSLDVSDTVLYDVAAWVYYWYKGWLG